MKTLLFTGVLLTSSGISGATYPSLNQDQIQWLGAQIYSNECNSQPECLTAWNEGENFPSMGIGHFIWYQENQQEIFTESFPDLIHFMQQSDIQIPDWLIATNLEAPWRDRGEFLTDQDSERMKMLRNFLATHTREQTAFIINRFEDSLVSMLESVTSDETELGNEQKFKSTQDHIEENFFKVANSHTPYGLYALIDYVNFKGTGVSSLETYNGQGWGLKQVLLEMAALDELREMPESLQAFAEAASRVLTRRVENAPPERNETRWLTGWNNRLETYLPPISVYSDLENAL
jgi:hypothetical protein